MLMRELAVSTVGTDVEDTEMLGKSLSSLAEGGVF